MTSRYELRSHRRSVSNSTTLTNTASPTSPTHTRHLSPSPVPTHHRTPSDNPDVRYAIPSLINLTLISTPTIKSKWRLHPTLSHQHVHCEDTARQYEYTHHGPTSPATHLSYTPSTMFNQPRPTRHRSFTTPRRPVYASDEH
jgi:hypothetical protein